MVKKVPSDKTWTPSKPTSRGAIAYHDAVANSYWHIENINHLIKIVSKKIKHDDVVIDFGAGTGASAIYVLKDLKKNFKLWLVDNSPSWLGKAYELFKNKPEVKFYILDKIQNGHATLEKVIGTKVAHHVLSANTVHLIPNLEDTFKGIYAALKPHGIFTFQSGSIIRSGREEGILILDNTVNSVHDIAIKIILVNDRFAKYRKGLKKRAKQEMPQRKFVFPDPRPVEYYVDKLKRAGFKNVTISYKRIKVHYKDWLKFLLVNRLQAGILPEIGGREPSFKEEQDRNELIKMATLRLFKHLETTNEFANNVSFTAEWVYIMAER